MGKTSPSNVGGTGLLPHQEAEIPTCLVVKKLEHRQQKQYCNKFKKDLLKKWPTLKKKTLKNNQGKIKIFSDNQKPRVYHQQTLIR